ncbi:TetR/AcrR family transcriptional regulator [Nocardiopsis mangrovi]|uniref:TetR/AcrR family transcriptional regulator n=1 Tax=Nocardiopsis mangrovi TaxID=1179818 RepID=A0ABV9DR05_9ACTN
MPRPSIPDRANIVLDHARALILEKGYDRATMAEVARRAGVGKGALYLDFASKEALLDALLTRSVRALAAAVRARVADGPGPVALSTAYRYGLEALLGDDLMLAFYLSDTGVLGGYVRDKGAARYGPRMDWLAEYLAGLQRAGLVRADLDPPAAATLLSVFAVGLINASPALGALSRERLRATVDLLAALVADGWETPGEPADPRAARDAHALLLDRLSPPDEGAP